MVRKRDISRSTVGVYDTITVGTTAVELKVGGTALSGRDVIIIQPKTNGVYYGYDSSVTTSNGIQLFKDQTLSLDVTDEVTVYAIAASGSNDVRIQELA